MPHEHFTNRSRYGDISVLGIKTDQEKFSVRPSHGGSRCHGHRLAPVLVVPFLFMSDEFPSAGRREHLGSIAAPVGLHMFVWLLYSTHTPQCQEFRTMLMAEIEISNELLHDVCTNIDCFSLFFQNK